MEFQKQCNVCGKELTDMDFSGGIRIKDTIGYGSKYDCSRLTMSICADCLDKLIDSCAISPVEDMDRWL